MTESGALHVEAESWMLICRELASVVSSSHCEHVPFGQGCESHSLPAHCDEVGFASHSGLFHVEEGSLKGCGHGERALVNSAVSPWEGTSLPPACGVEMAACGTGGCVRHEEVHRTGVASARREVGTAVSQDCGKLTEPLLSKRP